MRLPLLLGLALAGLMGSSRAPEFDPRLSRHTGRPHAHRREIARRLRQAERAA